MTNIVTVTFPDIGEGVVEGEVIEWLKQVDDSVSQDEPIVVVMTDKATVELPAPCAGKLVKQYYKPGEKALRDKPLYAIETAESVALHKEESKRAEESSLPIAPKIPAKKGLGECMQRTQAAPPARKLAQQLGLDISQVSGTGAEARVNSADVAKYFAVQHQKQSHTPLTHLPGDEEKPLIGIQNLMAQKMAESKDKIPHFSYFEQLDATRLVQLRQAFKEEAAKQGIVVTYMPFIIKALSLTLKAFPLANSCLDLENQKIILHKQHNVGIAISTKQGLIVPVLKEVENMSLQEVIKSYESLKNRANHNKLLPSDMKEGTVTISNFGVLGGGGMWATPIINYPETAILALARIQKQPIVRNGEVVARDMLNLSWSFDHRVIDGDQAASISHHLSTLLQNPAALL